MPNPPNCAPGIHGDRHVGKGNRAAVHDLGLAAGNLLLEATARGLFVRQMTGILPDKACAVYGIPEGFEAWTGIAIGYRADPRTLPDGLKERDLSPRRRRPLREFVFSGKRDNPSPLVLRKSRLTGVKAERNGLWARPSTGEGGWQPRHDHQRTTRGNGSVLIKTCFPFQAPGSGSAARSFSGSRR